MHFDVIKQLELDEVITNSDKRRFSAYGSVELYDRHNELIPVEEFKKALDDWISNGATILDNHTNKVVGKGLRWETTTKNGLPAVKIYGEIYKNRAGDKVWIDMKEGKREGISVGGSILQKEESMQGHILTGLEINEFSIVNRTGNQGANFESMSMAKSMENQTSQEESVSQIDYDERFKKMEQEMDNLKKVIEELTSTISGTPIDSYENKEETKKMSEEIKTETVTEEVTKEEVSQDCEVKTESSNVEKQEEAQNETLSVTKSLNELTELVKSLQEDVNTLKCNQETTQQVEKQEIKKEEEVVKSVETETPTEKSVKSSGVEYTDLWKKVESGELTSYEALQQMRGQN